MPLDVEFSSSSPQGVPSPIRLQAESISIIYDRSPIGAPLPGSDPILIDLGQRVVKIVIEGRVNETGTNEVEGATAISDKDDLEQIARLWYNTTITCTISADQYTTKLDSLRLTLLPGVETVKWDFNLQLVGFWANPP